MKSKLSNNEIAQILDLATDKLYNYFELDLNPRLRNSIHCISKEDREKQTDLYEWFDEVRKQLINN